MKLSPEELRGMSATQLFRDLEMLDLEAQYGPQSIKAPISKGASVQ